MKSAGLFALLGHASTARSQFARYCPSDGQQVCYTVNVPTTTASSGSGDIFFQIIAPAAYSWVALGMGTQMAGANSFVVYQSSNGQNVTVSPRLPTSHSAPSYNAQPQVSLMSGSGIVSNMMIANVKCSNCLTWSRGSLAINTASSKWVYAGAMGNAIKSDSVAAPIAMHDIEGSFTLDLTKAVGGSGVNPFIQAAATTPTSGTGSGTGATGATTSSTGGDGVVSVQSLPGANEQSTSAGATSGKPSGYNLKENASDLHGKLMGVVFLGVFPGAALMMRSLSIPHLLIYHAVLQMIAIITMSFAVGLGIWASRESDPSFREPHFYFGLLITGALLIQPILGFMHHRAYKRLGRRTNWSHAHIWYGRFLVLLGAVNGLIGLNLSGNYSGEVLWGVLTGLALFVYVMMVVAPKIIQRRKRNSALKARNFKVNSMEDMPSSRRI